MKRSRRFWRTLSKAILKSLLFYYRKGDVAIPALDALGSVKKKIEFLNGFIEGDAEGLKLSDWKNAMRRSSNRTFQPLKQETCLPMLQRINASVDECNVKESR